MSTQRHTFTADPEWLQEARDAVDGFVAGLQAGIDSADAQTYNADFAKDVMWGSPYGATVIGYDALHSIHRGMFERGVAVAGPSSRYQIEHVMAPTRMWPSPTCDGSRWTPTASRSRWTTRPCSPRWLCTCWCVGTDDGGLQRARTLRFARSDDGRVWFCPRLSGAYLYPATILCPCRQCIHIPVRHSCHCLLGRQ